MSVSEESLKNLIIDNDFEGIEKLIASDAGCIKKKFKNSHLDPLSFAAAKGKVEVMRKMIEAGADVNSPSAPITRAMFSGSIRAMNLLKEHGVTVTGDQVMCCCEAHFPQGLKWVLEQGVDPEFFHKDWACTPTGALLQTYTRSEPKLLAECMNLLLDAGAQFEDGPLKDMFTGRLDLLEKRILEDKSLLSNPITLDFGNHLTLRGVTLLHIAAEYNQMECVDMLCYYGADMNAKALVGKNGVGGQTPIYHLIGTNSGKGYPLFEYFLKKKPDLDVKAFIQADVGNADVVNKGKDYTVDKVLELTPLAYALRYEKEPIWRNAEREVVQLKAAGAKA